MGDLFDSLEKGCVTLFGIAWLILLGIIIPCKFIADNSYIGLMWWFTITSIILSWVAYFITKDMDNKKNHPLRWTFATAVWIGTIIGLLFYCKLESVNLIIPAIVTVGVLVLAALLSYMIYSKYTAKWKMKKEQVDQIRREYKNSYIKYCVDNNIEPYSPQKHEIIKILSIEKSQWKSSESELLFRQRKIREDRQKANRIRFAYSDGFKDWCRDNAYNDRAVSHLTVIGNESTIKQYELKAQHRKEKERQIADEARIKREKQEKKELINKVQRWYTIQGSLRYNYMLDYYPTTCEFEASDEEWDDRWTVWNFKNTPGKTEEDDHQEALNEVIPRIKSELCSTFGESSLKYLTLVCIPASSAEKTESRYEEFSERLCDETGMENAYSHMSVTKDSEEKKFGGRGITTNNVSFDEKFFKDKYVLLFDDVITKGESMLRFKQKLEKLGAIVVCGFSIGKTKHERA